MIFILKAVEFEIKFIFLLQLFILGHSLQLNILKQWWFPVCHVKSSLQSQLLFLPRGSCSEVITLNLEGVQYPLIKHSFVYELFNSLEGDEG